MAIDEFGREVPGAAGGDPRVGMGHQRPSHECDPRDYRMQDDMGGGVGGMLRSRSRSPVAPPRAYPQKLEMGGGGVAQKNVRGNGWGVGGGEGGRGRSPSPYYEGGGVEMRRRSRSRSFDRELPPRKSGMAMDPSDSYSRREMMMHPRSRSPSPHARHHHPSSISYSPERPHPNSGRYPPPNYNSQFHHSHRRSSSPNPPPTANAPPNANANAPGTALDDDVENRARTTRRRRRHPVERYVDEPLLCEYLFKTEVLDHTSASNNNNAATQHQQPSRVHPNDPRHATTMPSDPSSNIVTPNPNEGTAPDHFNLHHPQIKQEDNNNTNTNNNNEEENESYLDYNARYCLNYVRTFFNEHLDDSWFRSRYSPLQRRRQAISERSRAANEAQSIYDQALQSLQDMKKEQHDTVITMGKIKKKQFDSYLHNNKKKACLFVQMARLGAGIKPTPSHHQQQSLLHNAEGPMAGRKRKHSFDSPAGPADYHHHSSDYHFHNSHQLSNDLPKTHLHSFLPANLTLKILDVPPQVTDTQINLALSALSHSNHAGILSIYSSPVASGTTSTNTMQHTTSSSSADAAPNLLYRTVWVVFHTEAAKDKMLQSLFKPEKEPNTNPNSTAASRLGNNNNSMDGPMPKVLELIVDCTDPYGRYDIDADGNGAAPANNEYNSDDDDVHHNNLHTNKPKINDDPNPETEKMPPQSATVFVSTLPITTSTTVLSAAVSSLERIPKDYTAAFQIASGLDVARSIPMDCRLAALLKLLFPTSSLLKKDSANNNNAHVNIKLDHDEDEDLTIEQNDNNNNNNNACHTHDEEDVEDMLDVSIAYLRRVHSFSFYNGCTSAHSVGAVLAGQHPAGTVHLRLKDADAILKKAAVTEDTEDNEHDDIYGDLPGGDDDADGEANNDNDDAGHGSGTNNTKENDRGKLKSSNRTTTKSSSKDMLVRRLDDSIARALEDVAKQKDATLASSSSDIVIIDEAIDAQAAEIELLEDKAKAEWISRHALIDSDGRARCSFHFCRKLFKDKNFLTKHLLKKHPEFLRAELAKCHDGHMMKCWDAEEQRPVPPVLVDCGSRFGLVPSTVSGADRPMAPDPEPDLWKREVDRVKRLEEEEERKRERREAAAAAAAENAERQRQAGQADGGAVGGGVPPMGGGVNTNFIDVDDMKDEKVELSFDNVKAPIVTDKKKKKKKKKKLL